MVVSVDGRGSSVARVLQNIVDALVHISVVSNREFTHACAHTHGINFYCRIWVSLILFGVAELKLCLIFCENVIYLSTNKQQPIVNYTSTADSHHKDQPLV